LWEKGKISCCYQANSKKSTIKTFFFKKNFFWNLLKNSFWYFHHLPSIQSKNYRRQKSRKCASWKKNETKLQNCTLKNFSFEIFFPIFFSFSAVNQKMNKTKHLENVQIDRMKRTNYVILRQISRKSTCNFFQKKFLLRLFSSFFIYSKHVVQKVWLQR